jgi:signal transduction histidine kinase
VSPSLRARLTAFYGGAFALFAAVLIAASYWLMRGHLQRTLAPADADSALSELATQYLVALAGATLLATALGWALAGRELRSTTAAFERQERFVANASHELRSPLTVIRTEVDVALGDPGADARELRAVGEGVLETVDRMDGLLDGLMLLAQTGRPAERKAVDLAGVARAAAARVQAHRLRLQVQLAPAQVRGERRLLERLVENLIENAVRYNAPGGFVDVRTRAGDGAAVLRVENSGPVVSDATAARLLEPFERGGRGRDGGGAGLGLSIVRAVAEAHGGRVALAPRRGGGLAVEVVLPAG